MLLVAAVLVLVASTGPVAADRSQATPKVQITDPPQDPAARQAIIDAGNLAAAPDALSNCCSDNGSPGCDDASCEAAVCAVDPFCCNVSWDGICAAEAVDLCGICRGYCCNENGTPGCNDAECEAAICAADPFCCEVEWDQICADQAERTCAICITQAIPTVSKTGLGVLAVAMLIGGALLLRRRRTA